MNKYRKHSKSKLTKNLAANLKVVMSSIHDKIDDFDEEHKVSQEVMNARISASFKVALQMFEILTASELSGEVRVSAMQFLNVLVHRFGGKRK